MFPSGNALRLLLQQGFAWLTADGKTKFKREELSKDEALASFLNNRKQNSINWEIAKNRIGGYLLALADSAGGKEILNGECFEGLFRGGLDWEKYQRGRDYWLSGLTDKSQRHDAVICIGHYLWYGDKASGLLPLPHPRNARARAAKIEAWLEGNHNGRSKAINFGQWNDSQPNRKSHFLDPPDPSDNRKIRAISPNRSPIKAPGMALPENRQTLDDRRTGKGKYRQEPGRPAPYSGSGGATGSPGRTDNKIGGSQTRRGQPEHRQQKW